MDLEAIEWVECDLEPRTVRDENPETISGMVYIGKPLVVDAIAYAGAAKQELEPAIKLLKDSHRFAYCRLPLNIRPRDRYDLRFLSVDISLESDQNQAVCWSMEPLKVEDEVRLKTEASFTAGLTLSPVEIGPSIGKGQEYTVFQPYIEAFGLGHFNPAWEFRPTKGRKLSGIQLLHMIIQCPRQVTATCKVKLAADIFMRNLLWNYRTRTSDQSETALEFGLPG